MSEATKACNLTEGEIKRLISAHGNMLSVEDVDEHVERINYLNKRLKAFKEPEPVAVGVGSAQVSATGWPTNG